MAINTRRPFGLRDAQVFDLSDESTPTYEDAVDINCVSELTVDTVVTEAMLEGDDSICATHANVEAIELAVTHGGANLAVYELLFGSTLTDSGSTPNEVTYLDIAVSDARPYVGLIADSRGSDGGNTLFIFYKCKTTGGGGGSLSKGAFFAPQFSMRAHASPEGYDSDTIARWANHETATAIDSTWDNNPVHI